MKILKRFCGVWLFLFSFLIFIPPAFLDPEPHHDGYMLATSIAFKDGYTPNKDLFSQYGPIVPVIQGSIFKVFPDNLLSLRVLNAIFLVLISVLTYLIGKKVYSRKVGFVGSLIFILTSPTWTYHDQGFLGQWPWSTVMFTLLILCGFLLVLLARDSKHRYQLLWLAGFLLSLAVSVRNAALFPILFVLIANFFLDRTFPKISQQLFMVPLGFVSGLILFFVMMISQNNLENYLQDTIIGPTSTSNLDSPGIFLKNVFEFPLVALFLIIVIFFIGGSLFSRFRDVFYVIAFTLISLCSFYNPSFLTQWIIGVGINTQNTLYGSFLSIFQHLSIIFAMIYFVYLVACRFKWLPAKLFFNDFEVLMIGLGFCAISPIYPLGDIGHLWWGSPLLVTFSLGLFTKISSDFVDFRFLVSLLGSVLAVSFVCWGMQFTAPREKIEDESVFQHMYVSTEYVDDFRATTQFIARLPKGSIRFNCNDGAFAVWNKKYLSADPNFVGWGWSQVAVNSNLNFEVYCAEDSRDAWARARSLNGQVIDSNLLGSSAIVTGRFSKHSFGRENFLYLIKVKDS